MSRESGSKKRKVSQPEGAHPATQLTATTVPDDLNASRLRSHAAQASHQSLQHDATQSPQDGVTAQPSGFIGQTLQSANRLLDLDLFGVIARGTRYRRSQLPHESAIDQGPAGSDSDSQRESERYQNENELPIFSDGGHSSSSQRSTITNSLLDGSQAPSTQTNDKKPAALGPNKNGYRTRLSRVGVYACDEPETPICPNLRTVQDLLDPQRDSASPATKKVQEDHARYVRARKECKLETKFCNRILHVILGERDEDHGSSIAAHNVEGRYIQKFANVTNMKPDIAYGMTASSVHRDILESLDKVLKMDKNEEHPVAPNFFLEVKAQKGIEWCAINQATNDGAIGARAMDELERFGTDNQEASKDAKTLSATLCNGVLIIYAHHIAPQTRNKHEKGYYMTRVASACLDDNIQSFARGLCLYRNARDWCEQQRQDLRDSAHARLPGEFR